MGDRLTPAQETFVLCHLGVPRLDEHGSSLTIDGLVERPRTLRFNDLRRYSKVEVVAVHECCGSPFAPFEPTRRVCNVRWGGTRLADSLADCQPRTAARYVWSYGADFGEFGGVEIDPYVKDLPISRVEADVLIGYEMNGRALTAEQGSPARLVVPGFYGTNSIAHCRLGFGALCRSLGKMEHAREHLTTAAAMYREMDMRFYLDQAAALSAPM